MKNKWTPEELEEIESQLSCPSGANGIEVGNSMNQFNISMTLDTINWLNLENDHSILEIGHGNCGHLKQILEKGNNIQYNGLEISETMHQEAVANNASAISNGNISFQLYDGLNMPFPDDSFDKIMTVNTIYFWTEPQQLLTEIARVLKPQGQCIITYSQKDFMVNLPFVQNKFKLYDNEAITNLVSNSHMHCLEIIDRHERVKLNTDELIDRKYSMAKLVTNEYHQ
ncbi:MAG: class I SAM-dependent methyltransferase [Bacteroidota bacterium]